MSNWDMQRILDQVDTEIQAIARVLSRTPDDHPNIRLLLIDLASAHDKRFDVRHEPDDIQKVIEYKSIALTLTGDDDLDLPDLLCTLGIAHSERFQHLGDKDDMEKAVEYKARGVELIPEGHPDLPRQLVNLAVSYKSRFEHLGERVDIEKAIECDSQAVALTSKDHPFMPIWLEKLGTSHNYRFRRFGDLNDLESAIEYQYRALALISDDHPHMLSLLVNLAVSHRDRFERLSDLSDLERAIEHNSHAMALTPDDHPDLSSGLANLSASLSSRFKRLGELSDLDQAIKYGVRALALTPDHHSSLSARLSDLAVHHRYRFQRLGELSDLEQAIGYESRALTLTPDDHPLLPTFLANLSVSFKLRFERLDELIDLEQAIKYEARALALTPDDHPEISSYIASLAGSHNSRFECLGELNDLEQAIAYGNRALSLTPDDHSHLSLCLTNLAAYHGYRFRRLRELSDLEQAIEYNSCALAATTPDHSDSCSRHFNHAVLYVCYHEYSHDPSHLEQALLSFQSACISSSSLPRDRFSYARRWASYASQYSALSPIQAYQATIDLLPQFIWIGATANQRYHDLKSIESLPAEAAHAAILSSDYSLALEWLEHARCVVWSQNLMLRSPLDRLLEFHPALATRIKTIADKLHTAGSSSREAQAFSHSITPEQVGQDHRRLANEYEELLAHVRTHHGFEDFLRPMKVSELMFAARNGPIVVINCHEDRCDAILVLPSQSTVTHLPLPCFSGKKARDTRSAIQASLRRQGIRERKVRVRQEPGRQNDSDLGSILKILWINIVKPILDCLEYKTPAPAGVLPHITWCPTGAISFLPLHAAGDYDLPHSRVFDYVISSYTPTLTSLLISTPITLSCNSRVLAIGQATTPGHNPLPGTITELKYVKSQVENKVKYSELIDAEATPATVLDAMEEHDWVHLACHAHQNVYDPTKSGFFLHGGTLDLAAINRRSFKKKGLAFLSACQTATGDETLADEAVHLASGMLMAGYSSVIATMWSVGDADAPFVADKVYGELIKKGTLGNGEAGRALHSAVGELRESVGENEFGRWVPFIHIGS